MKAIHWLNGALLTLTLSSCELFFPNGYERLAPSQPVTSAGGGQTSSFSGIYIYVDNVNGNNTNSGLAPDKPFQSLKKAIDHAHTVTDPAWIKVTGVTTYTTNQGISWSDLPLKITRHNLFLDTGYQTDFMLKGYQTVIALDTISTNIIEISGCTNISMNNLFFNGCNGSFSALVALNTDYLSLTGIDFVNNIQSAANNALITLQNIKYLNWQSSVISANNMQREVLSLQNIQNGQITLLNMDTNYYYNYLVRLNGGQSLQINQMSFSDNDDPQSGDTLFAIDSFGSGLIFDGCVFQALNGSVDYKAISEPTMDITGHTIRNCVFYLNKLIPYHDYLNLDLSFTLIATSNTGLLEWSGNTTN